MCDSEITGSHNVVLVEWILTVQCHMDVRVKEGPQITKLSFIEKKIGV